MPNRPLCEVCGKPEATKADDDTWRTLNGRPTARCVPYRVWWFRRDGRRMRSRRTDEGILWVARLTYRDCTGGYRDLDALFGLVGGPAARALPLPALADVRTVTWPVGW